MDCSPPGSSVHGILQARILEWVAISYSRGSSQPREWICVSCLAGGFFPTEPPGKCSNSSYSKNCIANSVCVLRQVISSVLSCSYIGLKQLCHFLLEGFLSGSDGKESACSEGDLGLVLGLGRSPREGNGYPLQYSFFLNFISFNWRLITLQYCGGFCHTSTWICHGRTCVPPSWTSPTSLPILPLGVVPEHRLWVPCFMLPTCTGHLSHMW